MIVAAVAIPILLFTGLHLFVTYKAKQLLPTLVSRITDGRYTLTAKKFRFSYFSPYVKLAGVSLRPVATDMDEEYSVDVDSLSLSIESIIPIFLNRAINVRDIRVVHPSVTIRRNVAMKDTTDPGDIYRRVAEMQDNTALFLNELHVDACEILNGGFRFYPIPGSERNFNIEHVSLSIRDLVIPPYEGNKTKSIDGKIRLVIDDPRLSIPDSLISVKMDKFVWDNQERYLTVGSFVISQRSAAPRADSFLISLDTIRVQHVHWDEWLNTGLVNMDTLIAHNGEMYFESSGSKARRKTIDSAKNIRKLKVWDAIGDLSIGYFSARYINAAIVNTNPGMERSNSVKGDSLIIRKLAVRPEASDPLMIADLGLGVREFVDRGSNTKFQSSFSRMRIKGDTMILDNYLVQSTPRSRLGKGSSLLIPSLSIKGLSIEDLMAEKASLREVRMDRPELVLYANLDAENSNGISLSRRTLDEIRPYVDVERVILNDAKFTIYNKKDRRTSLGTQEFSAVIMSRAAMQASDMDQFLSSFRDVNLTRFFYVTPRLQMELFNGDVDYSNKTLHFGRAAGYLGNKRIYADLRNLSLVGHPDLHPFDNDVVWHFRKLSVDSGTLDFELDSAAQKDMRDPETLIGLVDSLDLGNLAVKVRRQDMTAQAFVKGAKVAGHKVYPAHYRWDQAEVNLSDISVKTGQVNVTGASAYLVTRGNSLIRDAHIVLKSAAMDLDVNAPSIQLATDLGEVNGNDVKIDQLRLREPVIRLLLKKNGDAKMPAKAGRRKYAVSSLALDYPTVNLVIEGREHPSSFAAKGEGLKLTSLLFEQDDTTSLITMGSFTSVLNTLKMDDGDNEIFRTGRLELDLDHFSKRDTVPASLDLKRFRVGAVDVNHSWKRDTMELNTGGITLGNIPGLVLRKDSLLEAAFKIPPATVLPSTFTLRTPSKKFSIQQFRVNTGQQFLEWDSLEVQNRISRDSFFRSQPFEKDYITFSTGRIRADALKPVVYRKDTAVYIRKLTVDPLHFKVERDKRMPDDTVKYRPLMTRMLKRLPFLVHVDSIQLRNSLVWHNVIDEKTEKEGTIYFTNVDGYLTNLKNYDMGAEDSLRLDLMASLMDQGRLRMQFRERYEDSIQGFLLAVRMGSMEMKELNRLMLPLFNVRADRGKIRDMYMKVKGTDDLAYGSMEMNYDRLRLSILNEKNKRRDMVSWLANLFVRGKNNKTGIVYAERLQEKSIFNYWARIAVNGLLTNLGVRQNGKQVRKFYKGLQKNQLPPDLF